MLSISSQSTVYVQVPVSNTEGVDPTEDVVEFAFIGPYGSTSQAADYPPTSSTTWHTGLWDLKASTPTAQILVGPSSIPLGIGSFVVWVRITDSPEIPVLFSGPMVVS